MSQEEVLVQIEARLARAVAERVFPGAVLGVVRKNGERLYRAVGRQTYESGSPLVGKDTVYDCASITKAIPTASIGLRLLEEGKIDLDQKLASYLPEFRNSDRDNVRMRHLFTYSLDGYGTARFYKESPEAMLEYVFTHDFKERPGTVFKYSNVPIFLLGLVIERVAGKKIDELAEHYFFKPLGMRESTFHPEQFPLERIAPTEINDWRGFVRGVVHDESAAVFMEQRRAVVGHAGLFSNAPDLLTFLLMLLAEGSLHGTQFFKKETVLSMHTNQLESIGESVGLGWELNQPRFMGSGSRPSTFGKTGFTGTVVVVDPEREVAYTLLSNRIYPVRGSADAINAVRRDLSDLVFSL
ncbi:MAG: serine hydrolase domain-containing protein [Patescibacteria group bacterium]